MRCCPQVPPSLIHYEFLPDPVFDVRALLCVLCVQVHGVTNDTIKFVQNIINTEINSATDNPVSFPRNWKYHFSFIMNVFVFS